LVCPFINMTCQLNLPDSDSETERHHSLMSPSKAALSALRLFRGVFSEVSFPRCLFRGIGPSLLCSLTLVLGTRHDKAMITFAYGHGNLPSTRVIHPLNTLLALRGDRRPPARCCLSIFRVCSAPVATTTPPIWTCLEWCCILFDLFHLRYRQIRILLEWPFCPPHRVLAR
jgi:hypothetical protein